MDKTLSTKTTAKSKSLERSIAILRALASPQSRGLALVELARFTGLPHPTVLRLLRQLSDEGFVVMRQPERRYVLGPLAFELGLAAADQFDIREHAVHSMNNLLSATQETCYLVVRSGTEAVCVDRREGTSPIRVLTLNIGSRRPLGVGAAGLAILSSLPDDESGRLIENLEERLRPFNRLTTGDLREHVAETRNRGFAVSSNWVTLGVTGIGVAIFDANHRPYAAISVAAVSHRMPPDRWSESAAVLQEQARRIEGSMQAASRNA